MHDRFVAELAARAEPIRLGGPFDDGAETGPLISAAHRDKVEAYVAAGVAEGAALRLRRHLPPTPAGTGSSTAPTVLDDCHRGMQVVQRGVVRPGPDRGDASHRGRGRPLANDTEYGLAGAVWTAGRRQARSGSPGGCATAPSGSTTTTRTSRRRSGAVSAVRHRPRTRARPGWRSTARPSTSGRTSRPQAAAWFAPTTWAAMTGAMRDQPTDISCVNLWKVFGPREATGSRPPGAVGTSRQRS